MLKKTLKKLAKATTRKREKSPSKSPTRLLTAEGWKRLMMKKHRS
jgi:hypothetical protein